jgi:hypothetical protein
MTKKFFSILSAAAVVLSLAMSATAATRKATGAPAAIAPAKAVPVAPAPPEKHPQIREALESLRNSTQHLEHSAHDFGGQRVEAIKAIDEAIHQLEICLQFDKD